MHKLEEHPYVLVGGAVAVVLVIMLIIVAARTSTPSGASNGWGDTMPVMDDTSSGAQVSTYVPPPSAIGSTTTTPFIPITSNTPAGGGAQFDMAAFLAQLTAPPVGTETSASANANTDLSNAYSFIPSGMISTSSYTMQQRSPQDQALYDYGNEAGSYVQTYDDTHQDAPTTLKAQIEDRQDSEKAQAVKDIGTALYSVGRSLEGIENVPAVAQSANLALAKGYEDIGTKLQKVPDAQRDSDLVAAIQSYDAAVDQFNKKYVALVMIFSGLGIKFTAGDPGAVFTFSQSAGL